MRATVEWEGHLGQAGDRDAALMGEVARGSEAAFRALFLRHQPMVYRTAYAVLLDSGEASDVMQEVFVTLHRTARRWRPEAELRSWLSRVTLNRAVSVRRRLRSFFRARPQPPPPATAEHHPALRRAAGNLRGVLAQLGPRQRAVLTLHLDQDLSPSEMAPLLGLTANATRVALHRALDELRTRARAAGIELPADDPLQGMSVPRKGEG